MRKTSSKLTAAVLAAVLSIAVIGLPAFGMEREGPRNQNPIVRVVKHFLKKFGVITNDEQPGVPHP
jgi:hypothetical protein